MKVKVFQALVSFDRDHRKNPRHVPLDTELQEMVNNWMSKLPKGTRILFVSQSIAIREKIEVAVYTIMYEDPPTA